MAAVSDARWNDRAGGTGLPREADRRDIRRGSPPSRPADGRGLRPVPAGRPRLLPVGPVVRPRKGAVPAAGPGRHRPVPRTVPDGLRRSAPGEQRVYTGRRRGRPGRGQAVPRAPVPRPACRREAQGHRAGGRPHLAGYLSLHARRQGNPLHAAGHISTTPRRKRSNTWPPANCSPSATIPIPTSRGSAARYGRSSATPNCWPSSAAGTSRASTSSARSTASRRISCSARP